MNNDTYMNKMDKHAVNLAHPEAHRVLQEVKPGDTVSTTWLSASGKTMYGRYTAPYVIPRERNRRIPLVALIRAKRDAIRRAREEAIAKMNLAHA